MVKIDPVTQYLHLSKLVGRFLDYKPLVIYWDLPSDDSLYVADLHLSQISELDQAMWYVNHLRGMPPSTPEWAHIECVLGRLGCFE